MKKLLLTLLVFILVLSGCSSREKEPSSVSSESLDTAESSNADLDKSEESLAESSAEPTVKSLVVPEGYTLARIGMRLEEMDVCTASEFILASNMGDFSEFPLIALQADDPNRFLDLEGYLFPDTYEIYAKESPDSILRKMLANTELKIDADLRQQIADSGYTTNEILALASIIEKEAYERSDVPVPEEMPIISSVLHNRLNSKTMLQCNVTATYVRGVIDEFMVGGKDRYNEFYNTYYAPGIPPGAICNPGMDAIRAAVNPADTKYMFFLTDDDKNFYYSETYEEHLVLEKKYLSDEK